MAKLRHHIAAPLSDRMRMRHNQAAADRVDWVMGFGYNDSQLNMASDPIGQRRFAQEKKPWT